MTTQIRPDLEATRTALDAAHARLLETIEEPWDDDTTNDRILDAMARLRDAQARHAAARSGLPHLPGLIAWD